MDRLGQVPLNAQENGSKAGVGFCILF